MTSRWIPGALGLEAVALGALLIVALDQYAHKRVELLGGVNTWGYRGAQLPGRRVDEIRIAVVGGSQAFGWGVAAGETTAAYVRQRMAVVLDRPGQPARYVTAVNLGAMGLPAAEYATQLRRYAYLEPDIIALYLDPVATGTRAFLPPFDSAIAAVSGYVPMLPLVLTEKGAALAAQGSEVAGLAVSAAGRTLRAADRLLYRAFAAEPAATEADVRVSLETAVAAGLALARGVVIVLPVSRSEPERAAHVRLQGGLETRYAGERRVRLVDLGANPRLHDAALRLDGVNFGAAGHSLAAGEIAPAVIDLLRAQEP